MSEYKVEYDVTHWQYVLRIDGETIPLGKQTARDAHWYAMMIVDGREKRNDSSLSNSNTAHN